MNGMAVDLVPVKAYLSTRSRRTWWILTLAAITVITAARSDTPLESAVLCVVSYLLISALTFFWFRLKNKLGPFTALLALTAIAGATMTLLAFLPSKCPGTESSSRCSLEEATTWGVSSSMLVVFVGFILAPPFLIWSYYKRKHAK